MRDIWQKLISGQLDSLLQLAQDTPQGDVAAISRLRRHGSLEEVSVVLEALEARRRSRGRLRESPSWLMDREGMEQATRTTVAEHKAQRMRSAIGSETVIDLCCGIGSDTAALAQSGPVIYVDHDPVRVELTRFNLTRSAKNPSNSHPLVADAKCLPLPPLPLHVDPARRVDGRRVHDFEGMVPGPEILNRLIERHHSVALKCGPGISVEDLPPGEIEWLQDGNDLVEATLWCGNLAQSARRSATLLRQSLTISGEQEPLQQSSLKNPAFLHEPCSVIERSGLVCKVQGEVAAGEWHPGLGWLAGEEERTSPWFRSFAVVAQMGWHEKKIIDWFRQQGCSPASIKTRGVQENPSQLIKRFKGDPGPWILALLRRGRQIEACILQELNPLTG